MGCASRVQSRAVFVSRWARHSVIIVLNYVTLQNILSNGT
jgi:hypothetical protein